METRSTWLRLSSLAERSRSSRSSKRHNGACFAAAAALGCAPPPGCLAALSLAVLSLAALSLAVLSLVAATRVGDVFVPAYNCCSCGALARSTAATLGSHERRRRQASIRAPPPHHGSGAAGVEPSRACSEAAGAGGAVEARASGRACALAPSAVGATAAAALSSSLAASAAHTHRATIDCSLRASSAPSTEACAALPPALLYSGGGGWVSPLLASSFASSGPACRLPPSPSTLCGRARPGSSHRCVASSQRISPLASRLVSELRRMDRTTEACAMRHSSSTNPESCTLTPPSPPVPAAPPSPPAAPRPVRMWVAATFNLLAPAEGGLAALAEAGLAAEVGLAAAAVAAA